MLCRRLTAFRDLRATFTTLPRRHQVHSMLQVTIYNILSMWYICTNIRHWWLLLLFNVVLYIKSAHIIRTSIRLFWTPWNYIGKIWVHLIFRQVCVKWRCNHRWLWLNYIKYMVSSNVIWLYFQNTYLGY